MEELNERAAVNFLTSATSVEGFCLFLYLLNNQLLYLRRVIPVDARLNSTEGWFEYLWLNLGSDEVLYLVRFSVRLLDCQWYHITGLFVFLLLGLNHSKSLRPHFLVLLARDHVDRLVTRMVFSNLRGDDSLFLGQAIVVSVR